MDWNRDFTSIMIKVIILVLAVLLFVYRKKLGPYIFYFLLAVVFTFLTEIAASLYKEFIHKNNHIVYNIGNNFLVFLLFFIYYYKLLLEPNHKKIQLAIIGLFILNYGLSFFLSEDFISKFNIQSYFVQIVLLLVSIGLYLYELFNSEKVLNLKQHYPFWVSMGLVFIYFGLLPVIFIGTNEDLSKNLTRYLFISMVFIINIIGYSILISGIYYALKSRVTDAE